MEYMVNLARVYYPVHTLGPGERVGIWLAGCAQNCPGCLTPELQSVGSGKKVAVDEIVQFVRKLCPGVQGITISGGEPFLDPVGLKALTEALFTVTKDIIVYSGYTMEQLLAKHSPEIEDIFQIISVLIDGPYVEELNDGKGLRGSSNQQIHIFRNTTDYEMLYCGERSLQLVVDKDRVMTIGIPG